MYKEEINRINDYYQNKIGKLGQYVAFEELSELDFHPAIIRYISAEIDFLIFEDREKLLHNSAFDYSSDKINYYFSLIASEIRKNKRFSSEYISKLILHAVSFNAHHLVKPNWAMRKFVFENEEKKSLKEVEQIFNYVYHYAYANRVIISYLKKKNFANVSISDFENLQNRIDSLAVSDFKSNLIETAVRSMESFFNIGLESSRGVQIKALLTFMEEKNLKDESYLLKDNYEDELSFHSAREILKLYDIESDFIEEMDSPSDEAKKFMKEKEKEIRETMDKLTHGFSVSGAHTEAVESPEVVNFVEDEMDHEIEEKFEEIESSEEEISASEEDVPSEIEQSVSGEDISTGSDESATEEDADSEIEPAFAEEEFSSEAEETIMEEETPAEADLTEEEINLDERFEVEDSAEEEITDTGEVDTEDSSKFNETVSGESENNEIVEDVTPDEFEEISGSSTDDVPEEEISFQEENSEIIETETDDEANENIEEFVIPEKEEIEFIEDTEEITDVGETSDTMETEDVDLTVENKPGKFKEEKDPELFADENEDELLLTADEFVDENVLNKFEKTDEDEKKSIDVSKLIENKNMSKIIESIFDYDMNEFTSVIENLSDSENEEEANKKLDSVFERYHIKPDSKEGETFKNIIKDYFADR